MRRAYRVALVVLGAIAITFCAIGAEPSKKAEIKKKEYTISVQTTAAQNGCSLNFVFNVDKSKYYINLEAPFKIKLSSNEVTFEKKVLKKADIQSAKPDKKHPTEVVVGTTCGTGKGKVEAKIRFGFCDAKHCYLRKEKLEFTL